MTIDYCAHLRENGERLATAAARDLDAHVPSCPEWNVAKLVIHMGQHHRWVTDAIRREGDPPASPAKPGLRGNELIAWLRTGVHELANLLEESDDDAPAWSWAGDNRVGFWRRRTALETLIHRWDGENATGTSSPLDPILSSDCVDEILFQFVPRSKTPYEGPAGTASIATTDAPGAWTLALIPGELPMPERGASKGADLVLDGRAEDVALFVWGRVGTAAVIITGDDELGASLVQWLV